jgi:acetyl-CoA carboxylase alpha subunit
VTGQVKEAISADLKELMSLSLDEMLERRYQKFRNI